MTSDSQAKVDGRRLRRERGRAAVIESLIDLLFEGIVSPTADQIAERAELSTMSLYRYFDGINDLRDAAVAVWFGRYPDLLEIDRIGVGELSGRIARLVDARLRMYETAEPFGRLFRLRAFEHLEAREMLGLLHSGYVRLIEQHFEPELSTMPGEDARRLVPMIATLTSFEAWDLLLQFHGFDKREVRDSWTTSVTELIRGA